MTFGRIVIGTDYSGCTDFLTDKTGFPVPYHLRPLEPYEYPWSEGQLWAEPDHNAAVEAMRRAVANPAEGKKRGEAARDYVLQNYSTAAVGKAMRDRLDVLLTKRNPGVRIFPAQVVNASVSVNARSSAFNCSRNRWEFRGREFREAVLAGRLV